MSSKSAPPQPDYTGAANAQGAASLWNTQYQTNANRPDIYTPFGSQTWDRPGMENPYAPVADASAGGVGTGNYDGVGGYGAGAPAGGRGNPRAGDGAVYGGRGGGYTGQPTYGGRGGGYNPSGRSPTTGTGTQPNSETPNFMQPLQPWAMHLNLSPDVMAALQSQQAIQMGRSNMALGLMPEVGDALNTPPDWSSVPGLMSGEDARKQAFDATYGQAQSRLDPQWKQAEQAKESELQNQGILPGSQAYELAMADFARNKNDAYQSAINNANQYGEQAAQGLFGRSLAGHQQGITDILQRRAQPLNELQALLGGEQVGMPSMPGFSQAGVAQGPNYMGAAQAGYGAALNNYNAQQAQMQSLLNGGMNMASLAMMF